MDLKIGDYVKVLEEYECENCKNRILKIISVNDNSSFPIRCNVGDSGILGTEIFVEKALIKV